MFTVIVIMFCGVLAGRIVGVKCRPVVSRVVTVLIWALLFMLGVEVVPIPASPATCSRSVSTRS